MNKPTVEFKEVWQDQRWGCLLRTMITVADLPPLWFAGMDRRVMAHDGGDLGLVNLQASVRKNS